MLIPLSLISCNKENAEGDSEKYTLSITPAEVNLGDEITLTIKGENVGDLKWTFCYNNLDTEEGQCVMPNFVNGVCVFNTESLEAGVNEFYAECHQPHIKTNTVKVVINK